MDLRWYHYALLVTATVAVALLSIPSDREWGLQLSKGNQAGLAEDALLAALKENPRDRNVQEALVRAYRQARQSAKALPILENLVRQHPADERLRRDLVETKWEMGDVDGALTVAKLLQTRDNQEYYVHLCDLAGNLDESIAATTRLLDGTADDADRWARIAHWEYSRQNMPGFLLAQERLTQLRPTPENLVDLFDTSYWLGRLDMALRTADLLETRGLADSHHLRTIQTARLRAGDQPGALRAAEKLCGSQEATAEDWLTRAHIRGLLGGPEAEWSALETARQRFPRDATILRYQADLGFLIKKDKEALALAIELARLTGLEDDALSAAYRLLDAERREEGRVLLAPFLAEGREPFLRSRHLMGVLTFGLNDRAATRAQAEALEKRATHPVQPELEAARYASDLWGLLGEYEARLRCLAVLRKAQPGATDVLLDFIHTLLDAGRLDEAGVELAAAEKAPGVDPKVLRRYRSRYALLRYWAMPLRDLRRTTVCEAAAKAVEAALADGPDEELSASLVSLYTELRRLDEAEKIVAGLKAPGPLLRLELAAAFALADKPAQVRRWTEGLSEKDFPQPPNLSRWAWVQLRMGETATALRLMKQAHEAAPNDDQILVDYADAFGYVTRYQEQYALMEARAAKLNSEQAWLDAADRHLWASDRAGELKLIQRALALAPNSKRVWERLLCAQDDLRRPAEAAASWKKVMELGGPEGGPLVILAGAHVLEQSGKIEEATALYRKILDDPQARHEVWRDLAMVLIRQEKHKEAAQCLRQYLTASPKDVYAWWDLSDALRRSNQDDQAALKEAARLAEAQADTEPELLLEISREFAQRDERETARRLLGRLPAVEKLNGMDLERLAYVRGILGDKKESAALYLRALKLRPDDDDLYMATTEALGEIGDRATQLRMLDERAEKAKGVGAEQAWLDAADRRLWVNERADEARVLTRGLQRFPDSIRLRARRLVANARLRQFAEVERDWRLLVNAQMDAETRFHIWPVAVDMLVQLGAFNEAEKLLLRMLQERPDEPLPLLGLAGIEVKRDRYAQAVRYYQQYLQKVPDNGHAWYLLGEALYEDKRDGSAAQNRALALMPLTDDVTVIAMHARVHTRQGRYEQAFQLYERALGGKVENVGLACDYAYSLRQGGEFDREMALLRRTLEVHPHAMRPRRLLATALIGIGRWREAAALLRRLCHERPDDRGASAELAYAESRLHNFSEAMRYYQKAGVREGQPPQ